MYVYMRGFSAVCRKAEAGLVEKEKGRERVVGSPWGRHRRSK